jgi:hypothetical protein
MAFPQPGIHGFADSALFDERPCFDKSRRAQPVFGVIYTFAGAFRRLNHIRRVPDRRRERFFAYYMASPVKRAYRGRAVQEIRQAYVDNIAIGFVDGFFDTFVRGKIYYAVSVCQRRSPAMILIRDCDYFRFARQPRIGVKV